MDRTFKISDEFCLFKGDILDFDNPNIDESKISKVNEIDVQYVKPCNEYKIGELLNKYPEFLVANKCEIIERIKEGGEWMYNTERDNFIFTECNKSINKLADKIEVYVYEKSGNDLQYYMDNPEKLELLLTKNQSISIYDGINELIIYFTNILSILKHENIIHKDIKPGNIIVGDDLYNFPHNIKIIDLGYSFKYENYHTFMFQQSIDLIGDEVYENAVEEFGESSFPELSKKFSLDYYRNIFTDKYNGYESMFSVLTSIATPKYSAPEFDLRISKGQVTPTLGTLLCVDHRTITLDLRQDIPEYIIENFEDINYTKLLELYTSDSDIQEGYFNVVKDNIINKGFIDSLLKYNEVNDTNYNLFEFVYMMVNGLLGENPLIYNYDLYAFGLILKQLVDSYIDSLEKNKLFDPRKYRAKKKRTNKGGLKKKTKRRVKKKRTKKKRTKKKRTNKGGMKRISNSKLNYKELKNINFIIENMANVDPIYRWSLEDIISFYNGDDIINKKIIKIKGLEYTLCSEKVTRDSIIKQFKIINPDYYEYIKPKTPNTSTTQNVNWDEIKKQLKELGYSEGKIFRTVAKMKRNKMTSIQDLKI